MSCIKFGNYTAPKKKDLVKGNKIVRPFKERQFFNYCYVTDLNLHDNKYAITVLVMYDLKRFMEYIEP